jgi:hypothetical protein
MEWIKRLGSLVMALSLLTASMPLAATAQGAPPENASATAEEPSSGREVAAGFANVLYVPGKAIACTLSAGFWAGIMVLSLGGAYKDAETAKVVNEGCGGKWILKGKDLPSSQ